MQKRVLVIDGDREVRRLLQRALAEEGHAVRELGSALELESVIEEFHPDLVLCDVLMPGRDGLSVCQYIRSAPELANVQVIFVSARSFEGDKRAALEAGAAGYVVKPIVKEDLKAIVREALASRPQVRIWGCRGSVPAPERGAGRYGGNTSCVEVLLSQRRRIIFDAGTGIRALGNAIVHRSPMRMTICLTHYHWDHIQGLPFFKPLYVPGNVVEIRGPAENDSVLAEKIRGEMGGDYFPVSIEAFMASVGFVAAGEESFATMGVPMASLYAFHPGRTLAYRVDHGGRSVVYAPDNELVPESVAPELGGEALRFAQFAAGASLLIHDVTYPRQSYQARRGWGHSCAENLAKVAVAAKVERVLLFHHDPDNSDEEIEAIQEEFSTTVRELGAETPGEPAAEGMTIEL